MYSELIVKRIERLESKIKNIGYNIHKGSQDVAYSEVEVALELLEELKDILSRELRRSE